MHTLLQECQPNGKTYQVLIKGLFHLRSKWVSSAFLPHQSTSFICQQFLLKLVTEKEMLLLSSAACASQAIYIINSAFFFFNTTVY